MPRSRPPYPEEFRREAVELVRSDRRSLSAAAKSLGVSEPTLRKWVRQADDDVGLSEGVTSDEREELKRLRRENRILKEEREILKKLRPSSPRRARPGEGVPVDRSEEGRALDQNDVQCARRVTVRVSRVGDPRAV
jgi:transposase